VLYPIASRDKQKRAKPIQTGVSDANCHRPARQAASVPALKQQLMFFALRILTANIATGGLPCLSTLLASPTTQAQMTAAALLCILAASK